jgi:glycosyltransferase involved in cell wall biosynthesis
MRIGHYMQGINDPGGVATYIRRLSQAQRKAGHTVYFLDTRPSLAPSDEAGDLPIAVQSDADLFAQARSLNLDILHLHTTISILPPPDLPVIRTLHGHSPYCLSGSKYLKRWGKPCDRPYSLSGCLWGHLIDHCGSVRPNRAYERLQITNSEMQTLNQIPVITVSQFLKNQMVRTGYPASQIHVLFLPAPEIEVIFPLAQEKLPRFVFLGRITPEKGLEWLINALANVKIPTHLDIAGTGNSQQERFLQQLINKLGVSERVTLHGWVNEARVIQMLKSARALIFPSVWHEPSGTAMLEAAAAGRAMIASQVGGIPEYSDRLQNALLVPPNDVSGLVQHIERLATDWDLANQLGAAGRQNAKAYFSLEKHEQAIEKYYQSALSKT